jgi:hypothetical protein
MGVCHNGSVSNRLIHFSALCFFIVNVNNVYIYPYIFRTPEQLAETSQWFRETSRFKRISTTKRFLGWCAAFWGQHVAGETP